MSELKSNLELLSSKGGDKNFMIITLEKGAYIQFAANKGSSNYHCEVSSSDYIDTLVLDQHQLSFLNQLGWKHEAPFPSNFQQEIVLGESHTITQLKELVLATASVYGTPEMAFKYEIHLE